VNHEDFERSWRIFENINGWIRFSDAKALALLTVNGVLVGLLTLLDTDATVWTSVAAVATLTLAAISIFYAAACLNPTLKIGQSDSIIFYGHIAKRLHPGATSDEAERVRKEFDADFCRTVTEPEELVGEVADQVWANSRIAWKKYRLITQSGRWFFGALLVGAAFAAFSLLTPSP
jgi:hypothetical protein